MNQSSFINTCSSVLTSTKQHNMDVFNNILSVVLHVLIFAFLLFYMPLSLLWRLICYLFVRPCTPYEDLKEKVVLITGASSGIGKQLAYAYAKRGASIVLTARRAHALKVVAETAREKGAPDVLVIPADVSDQIESKKVIEETIAHFGKLDHLVVNAGIVSNCLFEEITEISAFKQVMDVNFWGAVYPTYFAIPHIKTSKGKIVVMSSISGRAPPARMSFYSASKAALIRFYETLRAELGPAVKITILTPGWLSSELTKGKALQKGGQMEINEEVRDLQIGFFPVSNTEKFVEVVLNAVCRGEEYLTWPSWYNLFHVVMCVAPEVGNWLSRTFYVSKPGAASNQTTSKKLLEMKGVKKLLYPSSIKGANIELDGGTHISKNAV